MADRDLGLVTNFDPDRMFELPPNQYDPKGYNFPIQGPVDVVRADEAAWVPNVAPDGYIAVHDIFPDPADGGRPPYELWCRLLETGRFAEVGSLSCGSLRVARRLR